MERLQLIRRSIGGGSVFFVFLVLVVALLLGLLRSRGVAAEAPDSAGRFIRGDCNADGDVNASDAIYSFAQLFRGGERARCFDACDVNDADGFDISDGIHLLTYFFRAGPPPLAPFPLSGLDPTNDDPFHCTGSNEEPEPPYPETGRLRIERDGAALEVGKAVSVRVLAVSATDEEFDVTNAASLTTTEADIVAVEADADSVHLRGVRAGSTTLIANLASLDPDEVRITVEETPVPSDGEARPSVSQYGITWQFDRAYTTGQFVNGDWWVVGPVEIVSTSPGWDGTHHGSMINPAYGASHGYDKRFNFDANLLARFPRSVRPGESVVSVISWKTGEKGAPAANSTIKNVPRPALRTAAVLTVLSAPPAADSFRPTYAGGEKRIFRLEDLHLDRLPHLARPGNVPSIADFERRTSRVWLDHLDKWPTRYICPSENFPNYARDSTSIFNDAALLLLLDFPDEEKLDLLIRVVQIGIDYYGVLETGGRWGQNGGGLGSGRKWPILLAGILLDDDKMLGIGADYPSASSQEDCQTFYLTKEKASHYPGLRIGDAVWAEHGCWNPGSHYSDPGNTGYQWCCTGNVWGGAALGARVLGAVDLWNHPAFFDYVDWYMAQGTPGDWQRSWSDFAEAMWDRYR